MFSLVASVCRDHGHCSHDKHRMRISARARTHRAPSRRTSRLAMAAASTTAAAGSLGCPSRARSAPSSPPRGPSCHAPRSRTRATHPPPRLPVSGPPDVRARRPMGVAVRRAVRWLLGIRFEAGPPRCQRSVGIAPKFPHFGPNSVEGARHGATPGPTTGGMRANSCRHRPRLGRIWLNPGQASPQEVTPARGLGRLRLHPRVRATGRPRNQRPCLCFRGSRRCASCRRQVQVDASEIIRRTWGDAGSLCAQTSCTILSTLCEALPLA